MDGFPVRHNGQEIKGIKFGPEPKKEITREEVHSANQRIQTVLPKKMADELKVNCIRSLGEGAAVAQLGDFLYYLVGLEGQNPIQLGNQFGDPKKKYTKTSIEINPQNIKKKTIFQALFGNGRF